MIKNKSMPNKKKRNILILALWFGVGLIVYWAIRPTPPPRKTQSSPEAASNAVAPPEPKSSIPPYFETAEAARPLPALIPAAYFRPRPLVARAYRIAAEIPGVLAQQPCYCHCDEVGHRSLLDCYASDHGAG